MVDGRAVGVLPPSDAPTDVVRLRLSPSGRRCKGEGWARRSCGDQLAMPPRDGLPTRLQVLRVNPARHLYERLGFAVVGETPTHYLMVAPAHTLQIERRARAMNAPRARLPPEFR